MHPKSKPVSCLRALSWACVLLAAAVLTLGALPAVAHAAGGIAYVQGTAFGTGTKVASVTARLAGAVGAGDLLVGWFSQFDAAGDVRVSDDVNGAWTRAPASVPFGSGGDNALFYVQNAAVSADGLTVTTSASAATYLQGTVTEYSGIATSGALEQAATGKGNGTAVATTATGAVGAGDLVLSALITGGAPGSTAPGSSQGVAYTARAMTPSGAVFTEDITSSAAGAQTGTASLQAATDWYAVVAAFRPAATTTTRPPPAPTGLTRTGATATQVGLSWTAATGDSPITGYTVYRDGTALGTSTTTAYTDTTAAPATSYSYTVTATDQAGRTSPPSAPLTVATPAAQDPCDTATLISSLTAANAASGGGTVTLAAGCTYTLTAADNSSDGPTGLPAITGRVTVVGNGATITRSTAAGTAHFRLMDVAVGGTLELRDLTLAHGIADDGVDGGGGVYNRGHLTVSGVTFTGNAAPAPTGTAGGAIENSGTLDVTGSTFTGGVAQEGGGVFNQAQATISDSSFTDNTATIYGGGALLNANGTMTVTGSTFTGNTGPGGGALDNDTTVHISDSTFSGNSAGDHGGGAVQNFGTITLTTSTVAGNSSPYGADIYNYGSSQLTVSNSIVADGGTGQNCGGTAIIDGGYNLDTGNTCGFTAATGSLSGTAPQLQAPAANGGPTATMALSPGSPAVDVIPASAPGCAGTADQRGVDRPQGAACDIGAYELIPAGSSAQPAMS